MAAHITGSITSSSSNVNMTSLGAEDYHIFENTGLNVGQRKSGGGSLINVSLYNPGNSSGTFTESKARVLSATDSSPTASYSSDVVNQHVFWGGTLAGAFGYTITLPAGTGTRTAKLYFFAFCGTGDDVATQFEAYVAISDSSTSPVTLATPFYTANTGALYIIDLDYEAASAGQTLTVIFRAKDLTNGAVRAIGYHGVWVSAATSSSFNLSRTESVTAAESQSSNKTAANAVVESVTAAETQSSNKTAPQTRTESGSLVDVVSVNLFVSVSDAEAASASHIQSIIATLQKTIGESATGSEVQSTTLSAALSRTESVTAAESQSSNKTSNHSITETQALGESQTLSANVVLAVNESQSLSDASSNTLEANLTSTELAAVTDTQASVNTVLQGVSESASTTETQTHNLEATLVRTEASSSIESSNASTTMQVSVPETQTMTESSVPLTFLNRSVSEVPEAGDPYWTNVELLLKGDGAQNSAPVDSSSYGRALTANTSLQYCDTSQSVFGGASIFRAASSDTVESLSVNQSQIANLGTSDCTIEMFVRLASFKNRHLFTINGEGNETLSHLVFCILNDTEFGIRRFGTGGSGGALNLFITIDQTTWLNVWKHIAYRRSGNNHELYLDGVLVASESGNAISWNYGGSNKIFIGSRITGANRAMHGWIDSFRYTRGVAREIVVPSEDYPTTLPVGAVDSSTASSIDGGVLVNESTTSSESQSNALTAPVTISETASITDLQSAVRSVLAGVTESSASTDTNTVLTTIALSIVNNASGSDTQSAVRSVTVSITEAAASSDSESSNKTVSTTTVESSAPADFSFVGAALSASMSEVAVSSETITKQLLANVSVTESSPASESITNSATFNRVSNEVASLSDLVNRFLSAAVTGSESAPLVDAAASDIFIAVLRQEVGVLQDSSDVNVYITVTTVEQATGVETVTSHIIGQYFVRCFISTVNPLTYYQHEVSTRNSYTSSVECLNTYTSEVSCVCE